MIVSNVKPSATYALIVGIERYAAGAQWNLDGPARDACNFASWLITRHVPDSNIALFISPLQKNRAAVEAAYCRARPATRQEIYTAITGELCKQQGDLLVIYWSGHGAITSGQSRRLFYADATQQAMLNLDLDALRTMLHSTSFAGLPRQIGFIDTCANYFYSPSTGPGLPTEDFAALPPQHGIQQYFLFAAAPGEVAKNLDAEQTGLFTKELLAFLATQPAGQWPPEMNALRQHLERRFEELRDQGLTAQTPAYFWHQDWKGNEGALGSHVPDIQEPPDDPVSDPDTFLLAGERQPLVAWLERIFRRNYRTADQRDALFQDAGLHEPLRQAMRGEEIRPEVRLVDLFQRLTVFESNYHPLRNLLAYLLKQEKVCSLLTDEDLRFGHRLRQRADANLAALRARAALGRVEHTGGQPLGSGVLLAPGLLLTCPPGAGPDAWANVQVRLGFIDDRYPHRSPSLAIRREAMGGPGIVPMGDPYGAVLLGLDQSMPDYPAAARVRPLSDTSMLSSERPAPGALVYLWHHPGGRAAKLESGKVVAHSGDETSGAGLYYTIPGTPESRGGPLFDRQWRLVGLHIASEGDLGRGVSLAACRESLLAALGVRT